MSNVQSNISHSLSLPLLYENQEGECSIIPRPPFLYLMWISDDPDEL